MASLKDEIRSAVKETLKEELSRALGEHKGSVKEHSSDRNAGTSRKKTLSFEEFYKEREAERQKGFQPAKRKKKEPSSTSKSGTNASKKVTDVEIKVGLATWNDDAFKSRRGKTHTVKVKSNAVLEDVIAEAVRKHASFDQSFDNIPPYVLLYPDFREVFFIPGTSDVFTLSAYKEAIGKEYKRLTFYLVQRDEFNEKFDESSNSSEPESKKPAVSSQAVATVQTRLDDYMLETQDFMNHQTDNTEGN